MPSAAKIAVSIEIVAEMVFFLWKLSLDANFVVSTEICAKMCFSGNCTWLQKLLFPLSYFQHVVFLVAKMRFSWKLQQTHDFCGDCPWLQKLRFPFNLLQKYNFCGNCSPAALQHIGGRGRGMMIVSQNAATPPNSPTFTHQTILFWQPFGCKKCGFHRVFYEKTIFSANCTWLQKLRFPLRLL